MEGGVMMSQCLIKYHTMPVFSKIEVQLHEFLTLALIEGEQSNQCCCTHYPKNGRLHMPQHPSECFKEIFFFPAGNKICNSLIS